MTDTPIDRESVERLKAEAMTLECLDGLWVTAEDYLALRAALDAETALAAQLAEAVGALAALLDLNDNHGPFGGEMYQDRVDRTWESARATLAKLEAKT